MVMALGIIRPVKLLVFHYAPCNGGNEESCWINAKAQKSVLSES